MHRSLKQVWVVFRDSPRSDGVYLNGIFNDEAAAKEHCNFDEGIMLVNVGERLPFNVLDVEKVYYPCYTGTWSNSPHGRWTQRARELVKEFFHGAA